MTISEAREWVIRYVRGDDFFISYARADGAAYAARLASELNRRYACRFDQWASKASPSVHPDLLRDLRRSAVLVIVSTAAAGVSGPVGTEIREFVKTAGNIIPIDLDGTIRSAEWWPDVNGLAVSPAEPFEAVLQRISESVTFTRRNVRLRRLAIGAGVVFAVISLLSLWFGNDARKQTNRADQETARALVESRKANEAAEARAKADQAAGQSRRNAAEQEKLRIKADDGRRRAEADRKDAEQHAAAAAAQAAEQQRLAESATHQREAAEKLLTDALAKVKKTTRALKAESAVSQSREQARLAFLQATSREKLLLAAIGAVGTAPTEAAVSALVASLRSALAAHTEQPPAAFDEKGSFIAVAGRRGQGELVRLSDGRRTELCGGLEPIQVMSFSPDGSRLAVIRVAAGKDSSLLQLDLWDTEAGRRTDSVFQGPDTFFNPHYAAWSPDSSLLVFPLQINRGIEVKVGPDGRGRVLGKVLVPAGPKQLEFSSGRRQYLKFSYPGGIDPVELRDFEGNSLWTTKVQGVTWACFRGGDSRIVIRSDSGGPGPETYILVELGNDGRPVRTTTIPAAQFDYGLLRGPARKFGYELELDRDLPERLRRSLPPGEGEFRHDTRPTIDLAGDRIAANLGIEGPPVLFRLATQQWLATLPGWSAPHAFRFSPGGEWLAFCASRPGDRAKSFVAVWNARSSQTVWQREMNCSRDVVFRFSENEKRLFVFDGPGDVTVLDAASGRILAPIPGLGKVQWMNDTGTRAIVFSGESLRYWDVDRGSALRAAGLGERDNAEYQADKTLIDSGKASAAQLLEIARRRLRSCEAQ